MRPESPKLLEDVRVAADYILAKTDGLMMEGYLDDDVLKPAIERYFAIIGEALNRPDRHDPEAANKITDHQDIIAFRNVLIHGYDAVDDRRVWDAIRNHLPRLRAEVVALLQSAESES